MTDESPESKAVKALREAASELNSRADQMEAAVHEAAAKAAQAPIEREPLAPAESENEAAARLIALEGATTGRDRTEVVAEIERDFPEVDADDLTGRFYS